MLLTLSGPRSRRLTQVGNGTSQGAFRNLLRQKAGLSYGRERCAHKEPSRLVLLVQEQARGGVCARNPEIRYLWNEKKKKYPRSVGNESLFS